jgi:hypothetical protein
MIDVRHGHWAICCASVDSNIKHSPNAREAKIRKRGMGSFLKKVRHGEIDGPRKRTFTPEAWTAAFEQQNSGDEEDIRLFRSGLRIHTKLTAIRGALSKSQLRKLSTATMAKALVATANHQYEALSHQLRQGMSSDALNSEQQSDIDVLALARTQMKLLNGENYSVDSVMSSLLDGIGVPLKVALQSRRRPGLESLSDVPWNDIGLEMNLGIFYEQFQALWEDCVWNTYAIVGNGQRVFALPNNLEAKLGMCTAVSRKFALNIEATGYAMRAFELANALSVRGRLQEVQSIAIDGDNQTMTLGFTANDPHSQALRYGSFQMACPQFLSLLFEEPRERLGGLSINQLIDGWMVVANAATTLWQKTAPLLQPKCNTSEDEYSDMNDYIPFLDKNVLVNALHEAAGLPRAGAAAIVDFLTFNGSDGQELWTQPLVKLDDSTKLYIVAGAIVAPPNARYVAEKWMVQLDVDLESRGPAFEVYVRNVLIEATSTSPLLSKVAKVVTKDYTFRGSAQRFAQIDALFCVGSHVFVVEAKCILEPVDSPSNGRHRLALERAAAQANIRIDLIEEFREHFIEEMRQFGWSLPPDFRLSPIIAVSTWAHVGVSVDSVPVVDELVLQRFFEGKYRRVGLETETFSIKEDTEKALYNSAEEAELIAARYFEEPPQLKQYTDNLKLRKFPLPSVSEDDWYGDMLDFN